MYLVKDQICTMCCDFNVTKKKQFRNLLQSLRISKVINTGDEIFCDGCEQFLRHTSSKKKNICQNTISFMLKDMLSKAGGDCVAQLFSKFFVRSNSKITTVVLKADTILYCSGLLENLLY